MSEDKPPTKLSLGKKAKRISLQIVQVIFVLSSIFWLLVLVTYVAYSNVPIISRIFTAVFFLVLLLGSSAIVYLTEKALQEFRPTVRLNRDDLKQLGYAFLPTIAILILFYLLDYYFKLFPTTISANLSLEILKILIQANGFLIGFAGIVFAQMFWAIHNQQGNIQKDILENPFIPDEKKSFDIREDYLTAFEKKRGSMIRIMFIVLILFVISILLSLSGMAQTEMQPTLPTNPYLTNPFWLMTYGIFVFGFSIAQSKMDIREDVTKILLKRIKKQNEIIENTKQTVEKLKEEQKTLMKEIEEKKKDLTTNA
jgi:hypothetical protein